MCSCLKGSNMLKQTLTSSISEGETGGLSVKEPQLWAPVNGPLL